MSEFAKYSEEIDRLSGSIVGKKTSIEPFKLTNGSEWDGIKTSPVELHRIAGLDRNVYALARVLASEASNRDPVLTRYAIGEALTNYAKIKNVEPYQLIVAFTNSSFSGTKWYYGRQRGRYCASSKDPTERTVAIARDVLLRRFNATNGATRWYCPRVQDGGKQGRFKLTHNAIDIAKKWGREGHNWIGPLPTISSYELALFRPGDPTENTALCREIELGREGKETKIKAITERLGVPYWLYLVGIGTAAALV